MNTELITGISNADYHADHAYTSHSRIRSFERHGERYYYERYVTGEITREPTKALDFGTAFETLFQGGGDAFAQDILVEPRGHDGRTTAGKQWLASVAASGKPIVSHDDYLSMLKMADSMREHAGVLRLLGECTDQVTMRGDAYGLRIQARPDWLCAHGLPETGFRPFTIDLKTTKDLADLMTREGIVSLGYHTQAAIMRRLLQSHLGQQGEDTDTEHYIFAVEKCYPHRCALLRLTPEVLDYGDIYLEKYGQKLAACIASDYWPRALPDVIDIGLPRRAQNHNAPQPSARESSQP
jgi:hypothetical protein